MAKGQGQGAGAGSGTGGQGRGPGQGSDLERRLFGSGNRKGQGGGRQDPPPQDDDNSEEEDEENPPAGDGGDGDNDDDNDDGGTDDGASGDEGGDGERTYSAEYVARLRRENAKIRLEAKDLKNKVKTAENEKKSELDQLKDRVTELEAENTELKKAERSIVIERHANKLGAKHPERVARLLDLEDDADEKDIKAAIKELKADMPELFGSKDPPDAEAGARGNGRPAPSMNDFMRRAAGRRG